MRMLQQCSVRFKSRDPESKSTTPTAAVTPRCGEIEPAERVR